MCINYTFTVIKKLKKYMKTIDFTLSKDDAILIIKSMKIARARKKREVNSHIKNKETDRAESKQSFIHKSEQLTDYIEYLIK